MFSGRTQTEAVQIKARIEVRLGELGRDAMRLVSSRSSNILAETTNGPATLRRGVKLEEATYPS